MDKDNSNREKEMPSCSLLQMLAKLSNISAHATLGVVT